MQLQQKIDQLFIEQQRDWEQLKVAMTTRSGKGKAFNWK